MCMSLCLCCGWLEVMVSCEPVRVLPWTDFWQSDGPSVADNAIATTIEFRGIHMRIVVCSRYLASGTAQVIHVFVPTAAVSCSRFATSTSTSLQY